jgi:hypothetical protein
VHLLRSLLRLFNLRKESEETEGMINGFAGGEDPQEK